MEQLEQLFALYLYLHNMSNYLLSILLKCIVYLNNAVGGGTAFPKLNVVVGSIGGRLLLFGNVDENNKPHELALHQGLPPHEGEKWVFTLWFRQNKIN